jgi:hypothetical protein
VKKAVRLVWSAVAVVVAVRILDVFFAPALPLLLAVAITLGVLYVAISGFRGL